jgi:hypothetical protein
VMPLKNITIVIIVPSTAVARGLDEISAFTFLKVFNLGFGAFI